MNTLIKRLALIGAASTLLACAELGYLQQAPVGVNAEEAYLIGRDYHLAMRRDDALAYYQAALRAAPGHHRARNGLAALYADQGKLDEAISLWQSLTAEASGPDHAYLYSNLGYAYALDGKLAQAEAALQKACVMDPLNARAWDHLGTVLERQGEHQRAKKMFLQAATLRGHDLKSDYAMVPPARVAAARLPANLGQDPAGQKAADGWAQTEVREGDNGVYVLRRVAAAPAPAPRDGMTAPASAASPVRFTLPLNALRPLLLEIRNGNGVPGMAKALAREVGPEVKVVRLSNEKGFSVRQTRVEYLPAHRAAAEKLAGRFGAARLVEVSETGKAEVRLVLGRDLPRVAGLSVRSLLNGGKVTTLQKPTFGVPQTPVAR